MRVEVPGLLFDEPLHEYSIDGFPVVGVTKMLEALGATRWKSYGGKKAQQEREFYLARGTALHRAIALEFDNNLDESTVDEEIRDPLERWREWCARVRVEPLLVEQTLCSRRFRYAGTLDLMCRIGGRLTIADHKGWAGDKGTVLQLAAYRWCLVELSRAGLDLGASTEEIEEAVCMVVYMYPKIRIKELPAKEATNVLLGAAQFYNWRIANHGD